MNRPSLLATLFACLLLAPAVRAQDTVVVRRAPNPYGIQDSVHRLLDTTMVVMQRNALNAGKLDWTVVRDSAFQVARGAQNVVEAGPAFEFLYRKLGDFHGAFFYQDTAFRWAQGAPVPRYSPEVKQELAKGPRIVSRVLAGRIGYLRIPALNMDTALVTTFTQRLQDSLCRMQPASLRGLIIDLRLDAGGTMYPMIGGLAPILGEGIVGSFRDGVGQTTGNWIISGGNLRVEKEMATHVKKPCQGFSPKLPVVVLTSALTGSAGEATLIALKGRPRTRFIGEPTYGYVTTNTGFMLSATAGMNLAVGLSADRNGTTYVTRLLPDEDVIWYDNFADFGKDKKIQAALRWLRAQPRN